MMAILIQVREFPLFPYFHSCFVSANSYPLFEPSSIHALINYQLYKVSIAFCVDLITNNRLVAQL